MHFTIGRAAEYFSAAELTKQTGVPRERFAAAALKELVDNALDACESHGITPDIAMSATRSGGDLVIRVSDNGPGLPEDLLRRIADFDSRTSDKIGYQSPTRGQMGNAWMTILGMPTALGGDCPVVVESLGRRHTIRAYADVAGNAVVDPSVEERPTATGTAVTLTLPAEGQALDVHDWARRFAMLNPHATFGWHDDLAEPQVCRALKRFPGDWKKWLPSASTPPAWYTVETLRTLMHLHIAAAQRADAPAPLLRTFVLQFSGLSGSASAKRVCDQFPEIKRLSDLNDGDVETLLVAMKDAARAPKPAALGLIGEDQLRARVTAWYGLPNPDRCWYRKALGTDADGLPFVVEAIVAETDMPGPTIYGLNFSPAFGDPLAGTLFALYDASSPGIEGVLHAAHVAVRAWMQDAAPTATVVHITSPVLVTTDRGKSRVELPLAVARVVGETIWRAAQTRHTEGERWVKVIRKANRQHYARVEQRAKAERKGLLNQKQAVWRVIPEAYAIATGGETMLASVHQLFYQIRPRVLELIDAGIAKPLTKPLDSQYVEYTLVPAYERAYGELPRCYREPRGVLYEPHSGVTVPLGTIDVDAYDLPDWRFNGILFVEKTGFWPIIRDAGIPERYDLAVIASQGFSPVACRKLLARAREQDIRVYVLHDADRSGYDICRTLAEPTERMPDHRIEVIDFGLAFEDGIARGLPIEPQRVEGALSTELAPRLTERERTAFMGTETPPGSGWFDCERIELNAFTSPQFLAFVEEKLAEHGADTKLVPSADTLQTTVRQTIQPELQTIVRNEIVRRLDVDGIVDRVLASALMRTIEDDAVTNVSPEVIATFLTKDRIRPWEWILGEHVADVVDAEREAIHVAIDAALPRSA
jgi:DNA topoisomerase VI subunit B